MISKSNYEALKKYGKVASWAIWEYPAETPKSNMGNVSMFDDPNILSELNPNYVFVGYNGSGVHDGFMDQSRLWFNFHSDLPSGNDFKLRYALMNTPYWGAYITDIIKDVQEVDSQKVKTYLKHNPDVVKANVDIFLNELSYLSKDATLIALGNDVYDILSAHLRGKYKIIKIKHYASYIAKEEYRKEFFRAMEMTEESPEIYEKLIPALRKKSDQTNPAEKSIETSDRDYPRTEYIRRKLKDADMLHNATQGRKRDGCFKIYNRIEICDLQKNMSLYVSVRTESERKAVVETFEDSNAIEVHENAGKSKQNICWAKYEHGNGDVDELIAVIKKVLAVIDKQA